MHTDTKLAESLSADTTALIPFLPFLLQDIYELGSDPAQIHALLQENHRLSANKRILDLGCGKGAVATYLAVASGCCVVGKDLMPAFITEAKLMAQKQKADHLCSFHVEDASLSVHTDSGYDVVLFSALGEILGTMEETLRALIPVVRSGGCIVIDDAYSLNGYGGLSTLESHLELFRKLDLSVVGHNVLSHEAIVKANRYNQQHIEQRSSQLSALHPHLADMFKKYVQDQQVECDMLESPDFHGILWLLQTR